MAVSKAGSGLQNEHNSCEPMGEKATGEIITDDPLCSSSWMNQLDKKVIGRRLVETDAFTKASVGWHPDSTTVSSQQSSNPDVTRSITNASRMPEDPARETGPKGAHGRSDAPRQHPATPSLSEPLSPQDEASYPEGGLRAWLVVLGSFLGMFAGFGLMNTVGTFQAYISTYQLSSYSSSAVGWIFSLYVFLAFFCGVQIGPVFDAKGPRWIVAAGTVCLLTGMIGIAFSTGTYKFSIH